MASTNDSAKRQQVSTSRIVAAPRQEIFDVLADPSRHGDFDGSGTVGSARAAQRLSPGAKFGMNMKLGIPYVIGNTVVEFVEGERIGWQHLGKHTWRYELADVEGGTEVTETFDWSTARIPKAIELAGYPKKHLPNMEKTLERLEQLVT